MYFLLTTASVNRLSEHESDMTFFLSAIFATTVNYSMMILVMKQRIAYLYYVLLGGGGFCSLLVLYVGAFEMMSLSSGMKLIIWISVATSVFFSIFLSLRVSNSQNLEKYIQRKDKDTYWNIEYDVYKKTNQEHGLLYGILRSAIVPFAPLVGVLISRNLPEDSGSFVVGAGMFFIAAIGSLAYIKFITLGLNLLHLQKEYNVDLKLSSHKQ